MAASFILLYNPYSYLDARLSFLSYVVSQNQKLLFECVANFWANFLDAQITGLETLVNLLAFEML